MNFQQKEFNKNKIVIPVLLVVLVVAAFAMSKLSRTMSPMTLEEYEGRYSVPEFPKPIR